MKTKKGSKIGHSLIIPGVSNAGILACIARSRTFIQYCGAVVDALTGRCPLCMLDPVRSPLILEDDVMKVCPCDPPEKNTRLHFLIVPKRHVASTSELSEQERLSIFAMTDALCKKYDITGRGILIRDGEATLLSGTLSHLHIHVMVPDGTGRVESPFFKGAESEAKGIARAIVFEKMRQFGEAQAAKGNRLTAEQLSNALCAEDKALVQGRLG